MKSPKSFAYTLLAVLMTVMVQSAQACTICFNGYAPEADVRALNGAIFMMVAVLVCVLGSFIAFFVHLARKAKKPLPEHLALVESLNTESPRH